MSGKTLDDYDPEEVLRQLRRLTRSFARGLSSGLTVEGIVEEAAARLYDRASREGLTFESDVEFYGYLARAVKTTRDKQYGITRRFVQAHDSILENLMDDVPSGYDASHDADLDGHFLELNEQAASVLGDGIESLSSRDRRIFFGQYLKVLYKEEKEALGIPFSSMSDQRTRITEYLQNYVAERLGEDVGGRIDYKVVRQYIAERFPDDIKIKGPLP